MTNNAEGERGIPSPVRWPPGAITGRDVFTGTIKPLGRSEKAGKRIKESVQFVTIRA